MLAEHEGPDTERDPSVPPAAEDRAHPVANAHGTHAIDEPNTHHDNARSIEESRAGRAPHPRDVHHAVRDTSPARPPEPEPRGASAYLRDLAESVEALEGHRVDNPIAGSIEAFGDEVSRTSGSVFEGDRCATLCPFRLDTLDGAS